MDGGPLPNADLTGTALGPVASGTGMYEDHGPSRRKLVMLSLGNGQENLSPFQILSKSSRVPSEPRGTNLNSVWVPVGVWGQVGASWEASNHPVGRKEHRAGVGLGTCMAIKAMQM